MNKRARIFFSGSVQGVGFRYAASNVARLFHVTGWVRNCSDGRVETVVEGTESEVEKFVAAVEDEMSGYVSAKTITWEPASGEWNSFTIAVTQ